MIGYTKPPEYLAETISGVPSMASMHYHPAYELYYLEAGKREYFVEDKYFAVSAGDFVLIKPSVFHRTAGGYALRTVVYFTDDFLQQTYTPKALKHILRCFEQVLICPSDDEQNEFKQLLHKLTKTSNPTDFANDLGVLLRKLAKCTPDDSYDQRISNIVRYINRDFSNIYSIDQVAKHTHLSKFHLCRLFKESTGVTLIDYINTIKIKNACEFLEKTDKDMVEISQLCGFNSSSYFSSVFKTIKSMTPSEYRRRNT